MQTAPPPDCGAAPVFVLLDDSTATAAQPASRLYTDYSHSHVCTDAATLETVCQQVDADLRRGLHATLLIDYEWGARLQGVGVANGKPGQADEVGEAGENVSGALRVLMFRQCQRLSGDAVDAWLSALDGGDPPSAGGVAEVRASVSPAQFHAAVDQIQTLLHSGACYQINYTYRLHGQQYGSVVGLYRRLRALQPVPYGVLARLPPTDCASDGPEWVLSRSPELLVQHRDGQLLTRPMKGTAERNNGPASDPEIDQQRAQWLARDPKNLAENVMIVDLLRNDLGRIAQTGSVQVPQRFEVESYATLHQMTSTVTATLQPGIQLPELLRAVFPCGSITGAPKRQSMRHIAELECSARGLYCGAIGWLEAPAPGNKLGALCLSVAIRTLTLGPMQQGSRAATLGIGSGIVLDSEPEQEYQETLWKARFLRAVDPGLGLFETMRWQRGRLWQVERHLQRLQHSALALGFHCDAQAVRSQLLHYTRSLEPAVALRVRIDLDHRGQVQFRHAVLEPLAAGAVGLVLSRQLLPDVEQALRQHKTTLRGAYDAAVAAAGRVQAFDAVFVNGAGEVTEGGRSNLLARLGGRWCTPSLHCGVLPGVMRQRLLQCWPGLEERVFSLDELLLADGLAVCSSLRGVRRAVWVSDEVGRVLEV